MLCFAQLVTRLVGQVNLEKEKKPRFENPDSRNRILKFGSAEQGLCKLDLTVSGLEEPR